MEGRLTLRFDYPLVGDVMRIAKDAGATIVSQDFALDCRLTIAARMSVIESLRERFAQTYGVNLTT